MRSFAQNDRIFAAQLNGRQIHQSHESSDSLDIDSVPLAVEPLRHAQATHMRMFQVLFVDDPHQFQVVLGLLGWLRVIGGPR